MTSPCLASPAELPLRDRWVGANTLSMRLMILATAALAKPALQRLRPAAEREIVGIRVPPRPVVMHLPR